MKMIATVFLDNLMRLKGNIIAIVIVCGLILLPSLYVWFSLLAFWNPEDNTGNIDVAVANCDAGYQSDLIPTRIDAGAQVVDELRANDKFHWIFVDEDQAIEGVKSGEYYAAIVIPEDFSKDMISVFSDTVENPAIQYYVNEKENPIAPHLTSIGATTIQNDIDQTFSQTVTDIALSTNSNLTQFLNGEGISAYAHALVGHLDSAIDEMSMDASQVRAFSALLQQSQTLIETASNALGSTGEITDKISPLVDETNSGLNEALEGADGFAALASEAIDQARGALSKVETSANSAFDSLKEDPTAIVTSLDALQGDLDQTKSAYEQARSAVATLDPNSTVIPIIDSIITEVDGLEQDLGSISQEIAAGTSDIESARAKIAAVVNEATDALNEAQSTYKNKLEAQATSLRSSLDSLGGNAKSIASELDQTAETLANSSQPLLESITEVRASLDTTASLLEESATSLATSRNELTKAIASNDLAEVRRIVSDDPTTLAHTLTAPTKLEKHAIYGVANYGSAMSPFYTSLGLFIGAIFLVIILKVKLTAERREKLGNPKPYQEYFGNLAFFMLIALAQAMLVCTGNLFFLGVQCSNIVLYYLAGLACSFAFLNLIYALTVAFGDIGKALAVILLVAQVAGSGGELPIQLSAPIFQSIYPWLPFTHSMNLFQGAIAGVYGNQYLMSMACLLAFVIPALILGLVLRRPIMKLNDFIDQQLAKTGVL